MGIGDGTSARRRTAAAREIAAALLGLSLGLATPSAAEAQDGDAPAVERFVVNDFENPALGNTVMTLGGEHQIGPDPDGGPGTVGALVLPGTGKYAALQFANVPADFPAWGCLRLRLRRVGPLPGMPYLRIFGGGEAETYLRLPGVGETWKTFVVDLSRTPLRGDYDATKVKRIDIALVKPAQGRLLVDDVVLERTVEFSPERRARELEPAWVVDDFADPAVADRVDFKGGTVATVADGKDTVLRWDVDGTEDPAGIYFLDMPRNLRDYRSIRFRVRAEKDLPHKLDVKLQSAFTNALTENVAKVGVKWQTVEIPIPKMREAGKFDADRCDSLAILFFKPVKAVLFLDDIELVRGKGGWTLSEDEVCAMLFGEKKAGKGMHRPSKHFDLYTDSSAAAAKFPEGLEKAYDFARAQLGLPETDRAIPVYCFQNPETMRKYLVREWRWSEAKVRTLFAVGNARAVVLCYRAPEDSKMVHELVHTLFHRAYGKEGGTWLHEGVAVMVEHAWEKKDVAALFAPNLRAGQFLPLREFLAIPDLFAHEDAAGGAGGDRAVFTQAGAFYAFLSKGPRAEKWKEALKALTRTPVEPEMRAPALEKALDVPLATLEAEWVEWGGKAGN